jgi:hypothetical protein
MVYDLNMQFPYLTGMLIMLVGFGISLARLKGQAVDSLPVPASPVEASDLVK